MNKWIWLALAGVVAALGAVYSFEIYQAGAERAEFRATYRASKSSPPALVKAQEWFGQKSGDVPRGALRAGLAQKQRLEANKAVISGSTGTWQMTGVGNWDSGAGTFEAARVDSFAYDQGNQRLFAAIGSGGIWMSEAVDGDPATLADFWVSVSESLPSQVVSAVAWSPDADGDGVADESTDGTLIAVGGESVMGSSGYLGLGAFYTTDLGETWVQAAGIPDGVLAFRAAVDETKPNLVYAATSVGLFRSEDAGRSYTNVILPTTDECAGVEVLGPCQFTNYVTDVVIQSPGGSTGLTCDDAGCPVVAGVGYRTGAADTFQDGRVQAPANGIYRSQTGEVGTFTRVDVPAATNNLPNGFTPQERIGRIEMGAAIGPDQDHNYLYAIVQDSLIFATNNPLDAALDIGLGDVLPALPVAPFLTYFNGVFVSADFGTTWTRMADPNEIVFNQTTGSGMLVFAVTGFGPGLQNWYNAWIQPDPTRQLGGVPTRITFGLEEIWQNRLTNVPLNGPLQAGSNDFNVIGAYNFTGPSAALADTTTHPDQHTAIYIPTNDGGVCLIVGNDGGVYKQCVAEGGEMDNTQWGSGSNTGIYALLPYGLGVAKDGTVYMGHQDNGSGLIEPDTGVQRQTMGGDGFYAEVDPDNSDIGYYETQNGGLTRTTNRGGSNTGIAPSYTRVMFDTWFRMDPLDAQHMVTGAQEVYETASAETVTSGTWVEVFNLGTNPETGAVRTTTTMEVLGEAVYVGGCGDCGGSGNDTGFSNVLATNVNGDLPPQRETSDGWHFASAEGLPNRYITSFAIDPANPEIVYATLAGYLSNLRPPGSYIDPNQNIDPGDNVFKSTDAGETFVSVSSGLPDVQTNSIVIRGDQLIVGTDVGVFISDDLDGTTWAPLGSGLPSAPANMVRLQPKADPAQPDRLYVATFGRGVWDYTFPEVDIEGPTDEPEALTGAGGAFGWLWLAGLGLLAGLRRRSQLH